MLVRNFKEILTIELITLTIGLFAGLMLTYITDKIYLIPALLILLPGFLEMRGNISGSVSARLSAGLHVKAFNNKYQKNKIVKGNILASFFLTIIISFVLGITAYYLSYEIFGITNFNIIYVAIVAGLVSSFIQIPLSIFSTFWLFKRGHDPDNIMGPYLTATGDVISILSLLVTLAVFA